MDDPNLDVDETCFLVLKNAGPKGYPGFPEVGNLPLPKKILNKGMQLIIHYFNYNLTDLKVLLIW